ncbi:MAG: ATP-binding cassette domain-containing protein [Candidatus Omnitrophica bacterium]|nr:ATP-binding cassette domain-containing protein [Candidatus Omnitrophota bacterium]
MVNLQNVVVRKGGKDILKGIKWSTCAGEHWFVMGGNGSGKTTLMELLAGYVWPQRGSVAVLGETFGRVNLLELRTRVGFVSPWVFRRMAAEVPFEDVVASGFDGSVGHYGQKTSRVAAAVRRQLKFFGCEKLARQEFGTLSSGQQLKAVLARALVHAPSILILDEPFSLLDIGARLDMYAFLLKLSRCQDAPQMIMVTHHREDILPFFTKGLLLKEGRVLFQGSRESAFQPGMLAKCFGLSPKILKEVLV